MRTDRLNISSNTFVVLVYTRPIIMYTQHHFFRDYYLGRLPIPKIFNSPCILISADNWYWNDNKYRIGQHELILAGYHKFVEKYKNTKVILTHPDEDAAKGYQGIPSVIFNRNAMVDTTSYTIDPKAVIEYDAIYNATLYSYKRHELAAKVNNLGIIYYLRDDTNRIHYITDSDMQYGLEVREKLRTMNNVTLINELNGNYKYLNKPTVSYYLNKAKCGLCLSDIEGACLASIEYLLSGIPVVSTKNHGGRDVLLKKSGYAYYTADTPESVANTVSGIKRYNKNDIRNSAIAAIEDEWNSLYKQFDTIYDKNKIDFNEFKKNMIRAQSKYRP